MKLKSCFAALLLLTAMSAAFAQEEDLLKGLDSNASQKQYAEYAFKSPRVIMSHSIEMLKQGVMDFRLLHRFGFINSGIGELFGLDQASFRMSFDYGISRNLTVGIGRSTYKKELDGFIKYRLFQQGTGTGTLPFSLVLIGGSTLHTRKWTDPTRNNLFSSRLGYYGQALIGKKISNRLSLQLSPMVVHQNLVQTKSDPNDLYSLGAGARIKLSNRVALTGDYFYLFNPTTAMRNPLSLGVDIETGGHVFQLHLTNATGMNERAFIGETTNSWGSGSIQFGFNLSRVFQLKKNRL